MFKPTKIPWNKGQAVGARLPFLPEEIQKMAIMLAAEGKHRENALLCLGVDSMLRVSDLLKLKVLDVITLSGSIKTNFATTQQKTSSNVYPTLTEKTVCAVQKWIEVSGKCLDDYLFTSFRLGKEKQPLSSSAYRAMIKDWAEWIGLDKSGYSTHSIRRTKPTFLYKQGVRIELIALLLGHKDTRSTMVYLGIDRMQAQQVAFEHDIFVARSITKKNSNIIKLSESQLNRLADLVVQKLGDQNAN